MSEFEQEVRRELQDVAVPNGFAERVVGRIQRRGADRRGRRWRLSIAAGVLVSIGVAGQTAIHERDERRKAVNAQAQFVVAMRVTGRSLATVQRAMARIDRTDDRSKGELR